MDTQLLTPNQTANKPHAEYTQRLAARQSEAARLARQDRIFGNWRLGVFACGLLLVWLGWQADALFFWLLVLPVGIFLALAARHDHVIQQRKRVERAVAFYLAGLRRIDGQWQGTANAGARYQTAEHPYAADLDIFGRASLFELLCLARTRMGEDCLAEWLRSPAEQDMIRARQQAVEELRTRMDWREDLAAVGEQTRGALKLAPLAAWARQEPVTFEVWERAIVGALVAAVVTALVWGFATQNWTTFVAATIVEQLAVSRLRPRLREAVGSVEEAGRNLSLLALLLARLEQEPYHSPRLAQLRTLLNTDGIAPSIRIARLERLIELLEIPHNPILGMVDRIIQLSTFCAFALEDWRQVNGPHFEDWLRATGEFEAFASLSAYAYEHPADTFPEIVQADFCLQARGLAHPLLNESGAVRNDLELSGERRLYIVSGSNMSGKSTLLRALGVNVVLALAGAPVRAHFLRLAPVRIGASLRTQDSLEAGISRFYAEILRLRQIVELTSGLPPTLFLLDEILHGTNSHDRRQGAEGILRALLQHGAMGLVTTHDLVLARIAEDPALHAVNVHFEDQIEGGKMQFDYHLRPGVVTKSNALELMRAIGLEV